MSNDYIPRANAKFNDWQDTLMRGITMRSFPLDIPKDVIEKLEAAQERYVTAYEAAKSPITRTKASIKEELEAQADYEALIRAVVREYIINNHNINDQDRISLGLPVHDTKHTPAPPITSRPRVDVGFPQLQQHSLVVFDGEQKSHALPPHAAGFEVWRKIGEPAPTSNADWQLVVQAPHSPHKLEYDDSQKGLTVYYRVRWINTRAIPGPWSETVSAIIA
jgi:hypothetical protein